MKIQDAFNSCNISVTVRHLNIMSISTNCRKAVINCPRGTPGVVGMV